MPSPTALNLDAIQKALDYHAATCGDKVLAIVMSPFEVERLGFPHFNNIPIEGDSKMPTGRFRLECESSRPPTEADEEEAVEAVAEERTVEV